jgi:myo-inositol-1(or 4)-monophosphatase
MDASPEQLRDLAVYLADQAGRRVRTARREGAEHLEVDAKSSRTDLVTRVDRASEQWIREQLAELRPADAVLGEEGEDRPGSSGVRWVVDPIDGTVNFVLDLPQYAVSVAAERDGEILAGAVANPETGELFSAALGAGAFLSTPAGQSRLGGPRDVPLSRAVVGTGFSYDAATRGRQARVVTELLPRVADIRRLGAASLDLCYVAAGRMDAYFELGLKLWDYAAGGLIAAEAGCVASGLRGQAPSQRFYAVAGPGLADQLFEVLTGLDADRAGG